jgi:undecaprenyl-diphosphatase
MLQSIDGFLLLLIQNHLRLDWLNPFFTFYTSLGNYGLLWIAVSLLLLCFRKTRKAGVLALAAMLLGLLINNLILKNLFARPRPWLTVEGLVPLLEPPDPNSFPSGHTCSSFAAAGIWLRTLPRRYMGVIALGAAALMGYSRLYVGVHYPSDVLAGMCVGLLGAWAVYSLYKRWEAGNTGIHRSGN